MRRLLKLIALLLPLAWIVLVAFFLNLFFLRDRYVALWEEQHRMTTTHSDMSNTGNNLRDTYEYMQEAQGDYLQALQDVTVLAILPALFVYFLMSLSTLRSRR
jgi:hypothetical protein